MLVLMLQLQGKKEESFSQFLCTEWQQTGLQIPKFVFGREGFAPLDPPSGALPLHPTGAQAAPGPRPFRLSTPQALCPIPTPVQCVSANCYVKFCLQCLLQFCLQGLMQSSVFSMLLGCPENVMYCLPSNVIVLSVIFCLLLIHIFQVLSLCMSSSKSVITLYNVVESLVLCVTINCFGKPCFQCVMQSFGFTVLVVLVAFLLAYKDYGGRFNESFLTCAFLLFFSFLIFFF